MCTNKLTVIQKDKLSAFENDLHERINKQNDDERINADLTGLYTDIIIELSKANGAKAHLIFEYAALLCQEVLLHCGETAYIMGLESNVASSDEVFSQYQRKIAHDKNLIDNKIQETHSTILDLLGVSKGLLSDFTDTFQKVHAVTKNHLVEYIALGQSETEEAA